MKRIDYLISSKFSHSMKPMILVLLSTLILLYSCNVGNCDYYCDSGPLSLNFEMVNKDSGENLFTNGTFHWKDLEVLDLDKESAPISFTFVTDDDLNQLVLGPFGYEVQEANYAIAINSETLFSISLKTKEIKDTCCSTIVLEQFNLLGAEFSQDESTGVYEVSVGI